MKHLLGALLLLSLPVFFTQCKDDDSDSDLPNGAVRFEVTDGPIDDTSVKGAFVTVTAIKLDGKEISGFSKQTIDLMAYQNGDTKLLATADVKAKSYDDVTLVLDFAADADGNSPGAYVLTQDNVKHSLQASSSTTTEIELDADDFDVEEGATTTIVLDFDLRKAIRHEESPQASDGYDFVTNAELENAVRVVAKSETGTITGKVTDNLNMAGDKIIVYAYAKGKFDKEAELDGHGDSDIQFSHAVTSATTDPQGNYTLAFLPDGDYEIHAFGYEDTDNDGELEMKGELQLNLLGDLELDLNNLGVDAGSNVSLSLNVIGIWP